MLTLVKHYRFHAAHRNRELHNKCSNIHGHTYNVVCTFNVQHPSPETGVTIEFAAIDETAAIVFDKLDHSLLLHKDDPLLEHLTAFSEPLKITVLNGPTSAENLCMEIHIQLMRLGLPVALVQLMETPRSGATYGEGGLLLPSKVGSVNEHLPLPHEQTMGNLYDLLQKDVDRRMEAIKQAVRPMRLVVAVSIISSLFTALLLWLLK